MVPAPSTHETNRAGLSKGEFWLIVVLLRSETEVCA